MTSPLLECKAYLERRYREQVNQGSGFADTYTKNVLQPAWLWVSPVHLNVEKEPSKEAAVLVDPQVGILLYLIHYDSRRDLATPMVSALAQRSRLLLGAQSKDSDTSEFDRFGSWRVILHWLANGYEDVQNWKSSVAKLRGQAPHAEEIPVDIILADKQGWTTAFENHGFPRLLLNLRSLYSIKTREEVERWSSADELVEEVLRTFPSKFKAGRLSRLAAQVVERFQSIKSSLELPSQTKANIGIREPKQSIGAKGFRNLTNVSLDLGNDLVASNVIAGPNGSGKSALFEALSIALFGSSSRFLKFLDDPDVMSRDRRTEYLDNYLSKMHSDTRATLIIDGQEVALDLPAVREDATAIDQLSEGSLLSQEQSAEFCLHDASELGVRILRGYSDVAVAIGDFVEDKYTTANGTRQELLRSLGLRANITSTETAFARVARQFLDQATPFSPQRIIEWLTTAETQFDDYVPLARLELNRWQSWSNEVRRNETATACVKPLLEEAIAVGQISDWLTEINSCITQSGRLWRELEQVTEQLKQASSDVIRELLTWGNWLESQKVGSIPAQAPQVIDLRKELEELTKNQQSITKRGLQLRGRIDHLVSVQGFIQSHWIEEHPQDCPTCDSNLSKRGGIKKIVEDLVALTTSERANAQNEYVRLSNRQKEINEQLAKLGTATNPVSQEVCQKLTEILSPRLPGNSTLDHELGNAVSRDRLIAYIKHLFGLPSLPPLLSVDHTAMEAAKNIVSKCIQIIEIFEAPNNWGEIRKRLSAELGEIVKSHLPSTLEAVWQEVVLNMTPAPWLLRERAAFSIQTRRNEQLLTVRIGHSDTAPLARHILNQAEVHVLGLAWFLIRNATRGRFLTRYLVLDDPAQEMDQTSFRDLCRLFETIFRIHRVIGHPLMLIVMLHQDDRAVDAARALGATLHVLAWSEFQSTQTIRRVRVTRETGATHPSVALA